MKVNWTVLNGTERQENRATLCTKRRSKICGNTMLCGMKLKVRKNMEWNDVKCIEIEWYWRNKVKLERNSMETNSGGTEYE